MFSPLQSSLFSSIETKVSMSGSHWKFDTCKYLPNDSTSKSSISSKALWSEWSLQLTLFSWDPVPSMSLFIREMILKALLSTGELLGITRWSKYNVETSVSVSAVSRTDAIQSMIDLSSTSWSCLDASDRVPYFRCHCEVPSRAFTVTLALLWTMWLRLRADDTILLDWSQIQLSFLLRRRWWQRFSMHQLRKLWIPFRRDSKSLFIVEMHWFRENKLKVVLLFGCPWAGDRIVWSSLVMSHDRRSRLCWRFAWGARQLFWRSIETRTSGRFWRSE